MYKESGTYTGRKIRRTVVEQPTEQNEPIKKEVHIDSEITNSKLYAMRRRKKQEKSRESDGKTKAGYKWLSNSPEEQLWSKLYRRLSYPTNDLIGVFGMKSDNVVNETLNELPCNNIILFQKPIFIDDAYKMFGAMILNLITNKFNIRQDSARRIYFLLQEISTSIYRNREDEYYYYEEPLERLSILSNSLDKDEKCKEIIRILKEQIGSSDTKFIWNVEIDIDKFNHKFINDISKIASEDLIIIINTLSSKSFICHQLGNKLGPAYGNQILNKFFAYENTIIAD